MPVSTYVPTVTVPVMRAAYAPLTPVTSVDDLRRWTLLILTVRKLYHESPKGFHDAPERNGWVASLHKVANCLIGSSIRWPLYLPGTFVRSKIDGQKNAHVR